MDILNKIWLAVLLLVAVAALAFKESLDLLLSGDLVLFIGGVLGLVILYFGGKAILTTTDVLENQFK